MKCVIPCAGKSNRMSYIPKHLVRIGDKPLLMHIVDIWKDYVDSFVFILNSASSYLWEYLPENSIVVFQNQPKGLADAILQAEKCINDRFIVNLGDCLCKGVFEDKDIELGIGVWRTINSEYWKSYGVRIRDDGYVGRVIEKPNNIMGHCGMGTYFLDPRVFEYIRKAKVAPGGGDFTEVIQQMIDKGEKVSPVWFEGHYINVTSPEDLAKAERALKAKHD